MVLSILGDVTAAYLVITFLTFCNDKSDSDLVGMARSLMWPVTLYKACRAYVKELK